MRTFTRLAGAGAAALFGSAALAQSTITLGGTIRDFTPSTNPDFETVPITDDRGIVSSTLGAGRIPIYAGGSHPTIHSAATFGQWFVDTPGVNITIPISLTLTNIGGGIYSYNNSAFFPIDGMGFGNYAFGHNYHFTFALNSSFTYRGGETFSFSGDDDVWVFLNNKLAIDLGGVHPTESASVSLDTIASSFGMTVGNTYNFDFFFAERHTTGSNFRMDTSLVLSGDPRTGVPEPGEWAAMGVLAGGLGSLILRARRRAG